MLLCVVEWKEVYSRLMLVRVNVKRAMHSLANAVAYCSEGHGIEYLTTLLICSTHLHHASGTKGVLPCKGGGADSQLDLSPLTTLSVAG